MFLSDKRNVIVAAWKKAWIVISKHAAPSLAVDNFLYFCPVLAGRFLV
jgi:hypothetical protein